MNKNLFISTMGLITFSFLPLFGMEEHTKPDLTRTQTIEFLNEVSEALVNNGYFTKVTPDLIIDLVWDLALEGYNKDVQFLSSPEYPTYIASIQKMLQSQSVITEVAKVLNKVDATALGNIIRNNGKVIEHETEHSTPEKSTYEQPEKTLLTLHRKKAMSIQHKNTKEKAKASPKDIFEARDFLMRLHKMSTFESDEKDFHCIYGNCDKKYNQRHHLMKHLTDKHQQQLNEINERNIFNFTVTPKTLMRVMDFSNNFKTHKRLLKESSKNS